MPNIIDTPFAAFMPASQALKRLRELAVAQPDLRKTKLANSQPIDRIWVLLAG